MTTLKRLVPVLAVVLFVTVDHAPASAGAPTDQLRNQVEQVIKLLSDNEMKQPARLGERRTMLMKIADDVFDFKEMSQRTLGRHWAARTPAEQAEFSGLFREVLARAYVTQIENYNGEKVSFVNDTIDGEAATVRTKVVTKAGVEVPVDYRMFQAAPNRWKVYDVSIEGVSLVGNYRTQFNAIIQRKGYGDLVAKLKEKEEQLASAAPRVDRRQSEAAGRQSP